MSPLFVSLSRAFAAASVALSAFAQNPEPFPQADSKKGLQVQMADDAIALGVHHAALNCDIASLPALAPEPDDPRWSSGGKEFAFRAKAVANLDRQIKPLSDSGAIVYLIAIAYASGDPARDALMLHPDCDRAAPNRIGAFNAVTPEGLEWLRAAFEFLADRYSDPAAPHGRVWGYIIGNEVDSHWAWYNLGRAPLEKTADAYERAVRVAHGAIRKASANARVYLSLDHYWNMRGAGVKEDQAVSGRALLEAFARLARERGDFDWNLAYHPYPENLGEPRTWLDKTATPDPETTPRITFKNLAALPQFLLRPELQWKGQPRRVILSEQGFHCRESRPTGEQEQAAAYCYAWWKASALPTVDAFILHRHVDHAREGGLNLGLWTHKPGTISTPDRHRLLYDVFRAAGTPQQEEAFAFALPILGVKSWADVAAGKF